MNARNWSLIIIILMLITLIISLTRTVFKSNKSKSSKKIYSTYQPYKESKNSPSGSFGRTSKRNIYRSSGKAREIKSKMYSNSGAITVAAYGSYMSLFPVSEEYKRQDKASNKDYEDMIKYSHIPLTEYQLGLQLYSVKDYDEAIRQFTIALEKIDKMDILHAIDCYRMMAECYFRLKNKDGYIQNKIRQVRMERKKQQNIRKAFPDQDFTSFIDWPSTAETMKQLLKARNAFNRGDTTVNADTVRRAEYNHEIAKQVSK